MPAEAIRLYRKNDDVDAYNAKRIAKVDGPLYKHKATDNISGKISNKIKKLRLKSLKKMSRNQTYGLPYELQLKVGIRYMVTTNINIEDGLVNCATGILR